MGRRGCDFVIATWRHLIFAALWPPISALTALPSSGHEDLLSSSAALQHFFLHLGQSSELPPVHHLHLGTLRCLSV